MNYVSVKVSDDLYDLIAEEADALGINYIDVVVRAIAEHFGRPELGIVPRLRRGRPPHKRSKQPA